MDALLYSQIGPQMNERESTISHHICGFMRCLCDGDGNGPNMETAECVWLAKKLLEMSEPDRVELALMIAPELGEGDER